LGKAGFLYPPRDAVRLADGLITWAESPQELNAAKRVARKMAEEKYCWEIEKHKLVDSVRRVLAASDGESC
jgi:glycosyltransferase involved in cell wall biosynthesis